MFLKKILYIKFKIVKITKRKSVVFIIADENWTYGIKSEVTFLTESDDVSKSEKSLNNSILLNIIFSK